MGWLAEQIRRIGNTALVAASATGTGALHTDDGRATPNPPAMLIPPLETNRERLAVRWLRKARAAHWGDADWNGRSPAEQRAWAIDMLDSADRLNIYHAIWDEGDGGKLWAWLESVERVANGGCEA